MSGMWLIGGWPAGYVIGGALLVIAAVAATVEMIATEAKR